MSTKIRVKVSGISPSETESFYGLILSTLDGNQQFPIIIGQHEAQSIIVALESIKIPRPTIYDTFAHTLCFFNIQLQEVFIYEKKDGIYFTKIIYSNTSRQNIEIESRPSDAIALALRLGAPVFVAEEILEEFAISVNDKKRKKVQRIEIPLAEMDKKQLEILLEQAIKREDYEHAATIRDILKTKI